MAGLKGKSGPPFGQSLRAWQTALNKRALSILFHEILLRMKPRGHRETRQRF